MEDNGLPNWRDYFLQPTGNVVSQRRKWRIPEEFHYNAWIADRCNQLLEDYQADEQPFFLWASFFDPHPKYLAPEPWDTMVDPARISVPSITPGEHEDSPPHLKLTQQAEPDFSAWYEANGAGCHGFHSHLHDHDELAKDIACYYGMISCMDKYIGRIVDQLDALGMAENTLVIFTSDHGHYFGQHGLIAKGAFHYDDGVRVPMIARLPGQIPAGVVSHSLQSLVDYAPTLLSYCGIRVPDAMTGVDQRAVWNGEADAAREHVIVENRHQPTTLHLKTYIDARYKLTLYFNRDYGEIYDLANDPGELNNLYADAALRAELTEAMLRAEMLKEEPVDWNARRATHRVAPTQNGGGVGKRATQRVAPTQNAFGVGKSEGMRLKSCNWQGWQIKFDPSIGRYEIYDLAADPGRQRNLWHDERYRGERRRLTRALLFNRWGMEPLWMPRVSGA